MKDEHDRSTIDWVDLCRPEKPPSSRREDSQDGRSRLLQYRLCLLRAAKSASRKSVRLVRNGRYADAKHQSDVAAVLLESALRVW